LPTPKNDKRRMIRKKKRAREPAALRRRLRATGGKKKRFLILELIERAGGEKDPTIIAWTFHDEAMRGTVMDLHSRYKRYLRGLYQRTYTRHARAHARARAKIERVLKGRGPAGRVHDIFLLQAAEKLRRHIEKEERR